MMFDSAEGSAVGTGRSFEVSLAASILSGYDDAIIGLALDGLIHTWNDGAELLYGYGPFETVGQHISMLDPGPRKRVCRAAGASCRG